MHCIIKDNARLAKTAIFRTFSKLYFTKNTKYRIFYEMRPSNSEIFAVLRQYNPWWNKTQIPDLPDWRRAAFGELETWIKNPPAPRALLISGARQIGKTTLLLQSIQSLLASGVSPEKILYATFDHPLLKLIGLDGLLGVWKEFSPTQIADGRNLFFS